MQMHFNQLCTSGKWREVADLYKNLFAETPTNDHWSLFYVSGHNSVFKEEQVPCTDEDLAWMKAIYKDEAMPLIHRVDCLFSYGLCNTFRRDRQKAADSYRKCIDLCKSATPADLRKRYIGAISTSRSAAKVEDRIRSTQRNAEQNLAVFTRSTPAMSPDEVPHITQPRRLAGFSEEMKLGINENEHSVRRDLFAASTKEEYDKMMARFKVGGGACDSCNVEKPVGESLLRCGKCKQAWYCSKECQNSHWKAAHKLVCKKREHGGFLAGDMCMLMGF